MIQDPTSSGKGLVQLSRIGDESDPVEEKPGALVYRLYPPIEFSFQPAPCAARLDVWVSKELVASATKGENSLVLGPDVFDKCPDDGGEWHSAFQVVLNRNSVFGRKVYLRLVHWPPGELGPVESFAPEFTAEKWHSILVVLEANRELKLYQDGQLVGRGLLTSDSRVGTVGGHPGLYAYNWYKLSPPLQGMLLIDNFEIVCW